MNTHPPKSCAPGSRSRQRGIAMVEFAVGTPVLFFAFCATVELGHALVEYSALADAARDADRYLASNALLGSTGVVNLSPAVVAATKNLAVYGNPSGFGQPLLPGLRAGDVLVGVDASNHVWVQAFYHYESLFGGRIPYFIHGGAIDTGFLILQSYTSMVAL
jgi:TadE-like protein